MNSIPALFAKPSFLIQQIDLIAVLIITVAFFSVLLVLGIMKWIKLKAESEKLSKTGFSSEEDNKVYRDFREGHLYDNY
ncbi:MAG: hypothetical protein KJO49_04115 [Bacteroidia bacterium]|nr:hypothetical protein [Bacteroidia bacterium]MBT8269908.1 hypothetical protein [Bacteroidia bacterium]NNF82309.1 hypothetical protein [Flavobacteriaceae bacterium]NNK69933.1 hypothetical protein [Flavobacteriaceae bacterium]NNL80150.1 hypothetical protein [Flavobacteriaceae bacterium]